MTYHDRISELSATLHLYEAWFNLNVLMGNVAKNFNTRINYPSKDAVARASFCSFYLDTVNMLMAHGVMLEEVPDPSTFGDDMQGLYNYYKAYTKKLFDNKIITQEKLEKAAALAQSLASEGAPRS